MGKTRSSSSKRGRARSHSPRKRRGSPRTGTSNRYSTAENSRKARSASPRRKDARRKKRNKRNHSHRGLTKTQDARDKEILAQRARERRRQRIEENVQKVQQEIQKQLEEEEKREREEKLKERKQRVPGAPYRIPGVSYDDRDSIRKYGETVVKKPQGFTKHHNQGHRASTRQKLRSRHTSDDHSGGKGSSVEETEQKSQSAVED